MIDIPPDIAATAEALVDELHTNPDVTFVGILAGPTFERRIAEVLAAEREACAVRAEAIERGEREWVPESLWAHIKRDTAADIRKPRNPIISTPAS